MTQDSLFHAGNTVGDAVQAPYSAGEWNDFFWWLVMGKTNHMESPTVVLQAGVIPNYLNSLACTVGAGTSVDVASGAAIVGGVLYINDAPVNIPLSAPVSGTNYYVVGLFKDIIGQTVRVGVVGPSTSGYPAVPGFTWDSSNETNVLALWMVTVTSAPVVAVAADVRRFMSIGDYRTLIVTDRQGGSSTLLETGGTSNYDVAEKSAMVFGEVAHTIGSTPLKTFQQLAGFVCSNNGYVCIMTAKGTTPTFSMTTIAPNSAGVSGNYRFPMFYPRDVYAPTFTGTINYYFLIFSLSDEGYGNIVPVETGSFVDVFRHAPFTAQ